MFFIARPRFVTKTTDGPGTTRSWQPFVKQSDGYLMLGEYERVDLRPLPNDGLEICYVRPGHTNQMKLTLRGPAERK